MSLPFTNSLSGETSHPGKWQPGKRLSGKRPIRETTFREKNHPGK